MLEFHYNFLKRFCDAEKFKELELDTDSLYLALSGENLEDAILPEKQDDWNEMRSEIAQTFSLPTQQTISFPECVATYTRNTIRANQASLRKNSDVKKCCVYEVKRIFAMIGRVTSTNLAAKV